MNLDRLARVEALNVEATLRAAGGRVRTTGDGESATGQHVASVEEPDGGLLVVVHTSIMGGQGPDCKRFAKVLIC